MVIKMYCNLNMQEKRIIKHLKLINMYEEDCERIINDLNDVIIKESKYSLQDRRINSDLPILLDILTILKISLFNEYNDLFMAIEEYSLTLAKGMKKRGLDFVKNDYNSEDYDEFLKKILKKKAKCPITRSYKNNSHKKEFNENMKSWKIIDNYIVKDMDKYGGMD